MAVIAAIVLGILLLGLASLAILACLLSSVAEYQQNNNKH
jgi:hypothetical protein